MNVCEHLDYKKVKIWKRDGRTKVQDIAATHL